MRAVWIHRSTLSIDERIAPAEPYDLLISVTVVRAWKCTRHSVEPTPARRGHEANIDICTDSDSVQVSLQAWPLGR